MPERRDDIGSKILVGLVLGGFGTVIGFFVNIVWGEAHDARLDASQARKETAVLGSQYIAIASDLAEIKELLKRRIS